MYIRNKKQVHLENNKSYFKFQFPSDTMTLSTNLSNKT